MEQKVRYKCTKCGLTSLSPYVQYECPDPRCGYKAEIIDYKDAYEALKFEYEDHRKDAALGFAAARDSARYWEKEARSVTKYKIAVAVLSVLCVVLLFLK